MAVQLRISRLLDAGGQGIQQRQYADGRITMRPSLHRSPRMQFFRLQRRYLLPEIFFDSWIGQTLQALQPVR